MRNSERFDTYLFLIQERESVRLKKEAGEPKPWTEDEILQQFRFTNVRRMDDKVSRWLEDNWYNPYYNHPNMLPAIMLARFFNLPASLDKITELVFSDGWPREEICERLRKMMDYGDRIFNNAYMVRGNDGVDKVDTVVNHTVTPIYEDPPRIVPYSMRETWANLVPRYGMGSFMAGQIVADMRWAVEGTWSDSHFWAPAGPGSSRGVCWLNYETLNKMMKQEDFLIELRSIRDDATARLPVSITERMEMMDWQNTLCEFDKYMRFREGLGRPKQRYPGLK